MTFEGVKSKAQIEADSKSASGSGLSGMLARRVMKKNDSPRAAIMTIISETLEIATDRRRDRRRGSGRIQVEELIAGGRGGGRARCWEER